MTRPTPELPLSPRRPIQVPEALRERAAKTKDTGAAAYLLLAADTIDHLLYHRPPGKQGKTK